MNYSDIKDHLEMTLNRARFVLAYDKVRAENHTLAPYETALQAASALRDTQSLDALRERAWLTALLIELAQDKSELALTILTLGCLPALGRLRTAFRAVPGFTRDDLGQLVFEKFYEEVQSFPLRERGNRSVANLILATRGAVETAVNHARRSDSPECESWLKASLAGSPEDLMVQLERAEVDLVNLVSMALHDFSVEELDLIRTTFAHNEPLMDWVREHYPALSETDQQRIYRRVHHKRSTLTAQLRQRLRRLSLSRCPRCKHRLHA